MTNTIIQTGTPYEIIDHTRPGATTNLTVTAGTTTDASRPRLMLLVHPTPTPIGSGTVLEFNDIEAAVLAEGIYANLNQATRDQVRAALNNIDQETAL